MIIYSIICALNTTNQQVYVFACYWKFMLLDADSFTANLVMNEGESIHDFCWYPYMSASGAHATVTPFFYMKLFVFIFVLFYSFSCWRDCIFSVSSIDILG